MQPLFQGQINATATKRRSVSLLEIEVAIQPNPVFAPIFATLLISLPQLKNSLNFDVNA